MPLVRVEIIKGQTPEYKNQLLEGVHTALERSLGIPGWDRFQRLYELESRCFEHGSKSERFTMIEITMFPGRTKEQKAAVFRAITEELQLRPGIPPEDVFILLHEPPDEDWGLCGQQRG